MKLLSPIKTRELVRQTIFSDSKGFHIRNVIFADFVKVHSFRTVSLLVVPGHRPSCLQVTPK